MSNSGSNPKLQFKVENLKFGRSLKFLSDIQDHEMDMTSSVDSSQCSMAMVSINENDVNDKTDCSGKRVTLRQ